MILKWAVFEGMIPRLPPQLLPDGAAQKAIDCDLLHGELRGRYGNKLIANLPTIGGGPVVSVWTPDGTDFFAWPWETDVVKSMVVDDTYHRIFYTGLPADGCIIKVARTMRADGQKVINSSLLGGNYTPPEYSNPAPYGNGNGPDTWILGIKAPEVDGGDNGDTGELVIRMEDLTEWPDDVDMHLKVTFFIEDPQGTVVASTDVSNEELGGNVTQVYYTADSSKRGNKIQDMMFALGQTAPFKYYWFDPPAIDTIAVGRTVEVDNAVSFTYGGDVITDPPPWQAGLTDGP
jgi:hypothetical protein